MRRRIESGLIRRRMKFSIIIPVYNEGQSVIRVLSEIQYLKQQGSEIIVVDCGGCDGNNHPLFPYCTRLMHSEKGRATQMNAGARVATGDIFLFLHADTLLPDNVDKIFSELGLSDNLWGRFDIRLTGRQWPFRIIETFINYRSRITGIATGDQCIFVSSRLYKKAGGFPEIALMEDIAFSKRLLDFNKPLCVPARALTSSRRWEKHGIIKTVVTMWLLRGLYFLGVNPARLARFYG